jgi:hypothetical protein
VGIGDPVQAPADLPDVVAVRVRCRADGVTLVIVSYTVLAGNTESFLREMAAVGRSRRRTGAVGWGVYADTASSNRYIETFTIRSWSEHLAQHHDRQTGLDAAIALRARGLLAEPPEIVHAVAQAP